MRTDWLEVKMETDESPDPSHSQAESSPEISPRGTPFTTSTNTNTTTSSALILSPPAAFADTRSPHPQPGSLGPAVARQALTDTTTAAAAAAVACTLRNRSGGGSPLTPRRNNSNNNNNRRRLRSKRGTNRRSSGIASSVRTNDLSSPSSLSRGVGGGVGGGGAADGSPRPAPVLIAVADFSPLAPCVAWNVTATPTGSADNDSSSSSLWSSSPSIMATASMLNSTYGLRTPGASAAAFHRTQTQTQRRSSLRGGTTPTIVVTDSVLGSSPFAPPDTAFLQSAFTFTSTINTSGTPSITATASLMGDSPFAVRTPPSVSRGPPARNGSGVRAGNPPFRAAGTTPPPPLSDPDAAPTPASVVTSPFRMRESSASSGAATRPYSSSSCCSTSGVAAQRKAGTPTIVASNSVMGNSTMSSPAGPGDSPMAASPTTTTPLPSPSPFASASTTINARTTLATARTTSDCVDVDVVVLPASHEGGDSQVMDVTGVEAGGCRRDLRDSFRTHQGKLNEELQVIKGQFFNLLDDLGFSHDIYYKQTNQTPADTSRRCQHHATTNPISQSVHDPHASVDTSATTVVPGDRKAGGMSTPRSATPRRGTCTGRQRLADNMRSMYADLLIDQLLAQAQTDSSDTSNSPPEPDNGGAAATVPCHCEQASPLLSRNIQAAPSCVCAGSMQADHAVSVNINRGEDDTPTKGSARSKDIAALGLPETKGNNCAPSRTPLAPAGGGEFWRPAAGDLAPPRPGVSSSEDPQEGEQAVQVSRAVSSSANESGSSAPTTSSCSSNRSVPDLDKDLVSRIHYYSDFTIDRQKKIDEAADIPESADSHSPATGSALNSNDVSNESISHRCVEGSETPSHPGLVPAVGARPQIVSSRTVQVPVPPQTPGSPQRGPSSSRNGLQAGKPRQRHHSSDLYESDTSSGTGSMPRSQQSSSRHSSRHTSSSRDRHDWHINGIHSSSAERRSSSSSSSRGSRASRCSSHPLASSTLISDPSSHSGSLKSSADSRNKSGSVYTWSLENSSDENLHTSYLRSSEKQHRRSRKSRHQRSVAKSSHSQHRAHAGRGSSRPATLIGADSPPDPGRPDGGGTDATLHLSHVVSVIGDSSPARRFGGCSFENSAVPSTPRCSSLPRTSTRIGDFLLAETVSDRSPHRKASSFPELSSNPWLLPGRPSRDLNCAVSRIGPSNLSSGLHGASDNPSGSGQSESGRPTVTGQSSSTSDSAASFYSQCSTCNPVPCRPLLSPAASGSRKLTVDPSDRDEILDEILTNSPRSYDSGGVQAPYNSYTSPAGSATNDCYTTVSDSSCELSAAERCELTAFTAASPNPRADFAGKAPNPRADFAGKAPNNSGVVFKVPFIPAARSVRRGKVGGHPTHNVGVRAAVAGGGGGGTPHVPLGLVRHKEAASRRKLFNMAAPASQAQAQPSAGHFLRAPKITDRKALVRKFKKFSTHFKKDKDSAKIHTLATL